MPPSFRKLSVAEQLSFIHLHRLPCIIAMIAAFLVCALTK